MKFYEYFHIITYLGIFRAEVDMFVGMALSEWRSVYISILSRLLASSVLIYKWLPIFMMPRLLVSSVYDDGGLVSRVLFREGLGLYPALLCALPCPVPCRVALPCIFRAEIHSVTSLGISYVEQKKLLEMRFCSNFHDTGRIKRRRHDLGKLGNARIFRFVLNRPMALEVELTLCEIIIHIGI